MKKFLLFAMAAIAVQSQAATIGWGLGADIYLIKGGQDYTTAQIAYDSTLTVDPSAYLALVYIGQNQDSFNIADITDASVVESAPYALDTDGSTYADYDPYSTYTNVGSPTFSDGASFAVVWFNGKNFDYVYSIDDGQALNSGDAVVTINDIVRGSGDIFPASTTAGYGAVIAVPEPSVALMGLLGIALLLKRRKA